jgi:hypothetical protein
MRSKPDYEKEIQDNELLPSRKQDSTADDILSTAQG